MANKQTNIKNIYKQGVSCLVYSLQDQAECKPTIFSIASFSAKEREFCREQVECFRNDTITIHWSKVLTWPQGGRQEGREIVSQL